MRIAIWHNLPSGGGKRALYEQVRALVARGHTVEAWCPETADAEFLPLQELVREHRLPCPRLTWPTQPAQRSLQDAWRAYRWMRHVYGILTEHAQRCAAEMRHGAFDVLLAHPCQVLRVPVIGRVAAGPKVLYLQEPNRPLYEADPQLPWVAQDWPARFWRSPRGMSTFALDALGIQPLRWLMREELANARAFDRLLVNSLFSRESVLRAYGLEARVCYLGLDAERFRPSGTPRERLVVSLGALHPTKRVELAIQAVAAIPAPQRPKLLWLANFADLAYQQHVEAAARQHGVQFEARVGIDDTEVVNWLSRAAVMIYTARLEPFGLAPLEANACATPVVAVAEGGVRETIVSDLNGLLVDGADPAQLGAALRRLLDDPAAARRLGEAGRQRVLDRWQWTGAIEQLEGHLTEAMSQLSAPAQTAS